MLPLSKQFFFAKIDVTFSLAVTGRPGCSSHLPCDCRLDVCEPAVKASGSAVHAANLLSSSSLAAGAVKFPDEAESPGWR